MRIIAVRHGETVENVTRVIMGHNPGTLTLLGMQQAKAVAVLLKDEKIDIIFASDLGRAVNTTNEIAAYHNCPVVYSKELRERSYGVFSGRAYAEFAAAEKASGADPINYRPPGGENISDVQTRVSSFIDSLYSKYDKKTLLISTHAGIIRALKSLYFGLSTEEAFKSPIKNTGFMIFDLVDGKASMVRNELS